MTSPDEIRGRMAATGIGFAGLDGAWWLPATQPFPLPAAVASDLAGLGRALFALFDAVSALYATPEGAAGGLDALLEHKVPAAFLALAGPGRVLSVRPDFQLCPRPEGGFGLLATELEICPSAHGFAHALQAGYGLQPDLARAFARFLNGREFWFVGSHEWSEFMVEQLAFCRALAEHGARGRVVYDRPLSALAQEFREGRRWQPPMFGVTRRPEHWNDDLLGRLRARGLDQFAWPQPAWPDELREAVVFRFGYFDCFSPAGLAYFARWQAAGATLLNPLQFYLESKAVLAAANLPVVRARLAQLDAELLPVLDGCLPETVLLREPVIGQIMEEREQWVLKFAGFDGGQQAWGGRSVQFGAAHTRESWAQVVRRYLDLDWPAVAQRLAPTARADVEYVDAAGETRWMRAGYTRLRSFLLRRREPEGDSPASVVAAGSHVTVSDGTMQVSEATDAVQAPVIFV